MGVAGEPLMAGVPWGIAGGFFKGDCTWSSEHGVYGKLTAALPESGYPKCDLTGASIRRLQSGNNATNATAPTPTPPTPTPPTPTPPTPTPPTATANTTSNTTGNVTTNACTTITSIHRNCKWRLVYEN